MIYRMLHLLLPLDEWDDEDFLPPEDRFELLPPPSPLEDLSALDGFGGWRTTLIAESKTSFTFCSPDTNHKSQGALLHHERGTEQHASPARTASTQPHTPIM